MRCAIIRAKWSKKVIERREYLEFMAFVNPSHIIDIDETASSPEQYIERHGWSPPARKCRKVVIAIGNKAYSVIAAYTIDGFLAWEIIEDTIAQHHFISDLC